MDIQAYLQSYLSAYTPYKTYWNYEDGCVLSGCVALYRATGDSQWRAARSAIARDACGRHPQL